MTHTTSILASASLRSRFLALAVMDRTAVATFSFSFSLGVSIGGVYAYMEGLALDRICSTGIWLGHTQIIFGAPLLVYTTGWVRVEWSLSCNVTHQHTEKQLLQ